MKNAVTPKPMCQRRCIDDLCRGGGQTLCGQEFCESCGKPCMFDQFICDECREGFEEDQYEEDANA